MKYLLECLYNLFRSAFFFYLWCILNIGRLYSCFYTSNRNRFTYLLPESFFFKSLGPFFFLDIVITRFVFDLRRFQNFRLFKFNISYILPKRFLPWKSNRWNFSHQFSSNFLNFFSGLITCYKIVRELANKQNLFDHNLHELWKQNRR